MTAAWLRTVVNLIPFTLTFNFILIKCHFSMALLFPEAGSNVAIFGYRKATQKGVKEIHT